MEDKAVTTEMFLHYVFRLVYALFVGGLIGVEREIKGKPAGMRTNMLICMGSCILMILSIEVFKEGTGMGDPSRIASQVVAGMGFLGAGMIIRSRFSVAGLTSAATAWFVAAIGLVIGWGAYLLAAVATALTIATLTLLGGVEQMVAIKQRLHILQVRFPADLQRMGEFKAVLSEYRITPENLSVRRGDKHIRVELDYVAPDSKHRRVVAAIQEVQGMELLLEY